MERFSNYLHVKAGRPSPMIGGRVMVRNGPDRPNIGHMLGIPADKNMTVLA
jgi:hypothetical protein